MIFNKIYLGAMTSLLGIVLASLAFFSGLHSSYGIPDYSYSQAGRYHDSGWSGWCDKGRSQSPINIRKDQVLQATNKITMFYNYDKPLSANITNDGHYINVRINESDGVRLIMDSKTEYSLHSFHFHVGCTEHEFNSKRYDLELHLVHYNRKIGEFRTVAESSNQGVSVVAVLFEQSLMENEAINVLLDMIRMNSTRRSLDKKSLKYRELLPQKFGYVYQYSGSLTTPPCYETVLWNVINQTNFISARQLQAFKHLCRNSDPNCRFPQSLNGRNILLSTIEEASDDASKLGLLLTKIHYIFTFGFVYYLSSVFSLQC